MGQTMGARVETDAGLVAKHKDKALVVAESAALPIDGVGDVLRIGAVIDANRREDTGERPKGVAQQAVLGRRGMHQEAVVATVLCRGGFGAPRRGAMFSSTHRPGAAALSTRLGPVQQRVLSLPGNDQPTVPFLLHLESSTVFLNSTFSNCL